MLVLVVFTSVANTQGPAGAAKSADEHWSALDKVPRFLIKAEDAGFSWQEGKFSFLDLIEEACERRFICAMGNNPWPNAYFTLEMPNPEDAHYVLPYSPMWQMEQDEAIVIIGQTPPAMRYFSLQTWVQLGPAAVISDTLPVTATRSLLGSAFGDSTNNLTIHTVGPDPFDSPIVYIITGNRTTEQRVRAIAQHAGYPAEVINVEALSTAIAPLGIGPTGSILVTLQRKAVALVPENVLKEYVERSLIEPPEFPYRAFRLSPEVALDPDPYPAPTMRVQGTGQTEIDLYAAQQRLRQAILAAETVPGRGVKELEARLWQGTMTNGQLLLLDSDWWSGQQLGYYSYMPSSDTNYIQTDPPFKLREGVDEYVIVYGVNHQKTGKATYASFGVYVEPVFSIGREIGLGAVSDPKFEGSAQQYLGPDDPDADMLYAFKIARHCPAGDPYCMEVGPPSDMNGIPYNNDCTPQISLEVDPIRPSWMSDLFVAFRAYMEPATAVAPDINELVWDKAIYFGPYFEP
jgi:hypothetical protein